MAVDEEIEESQMQKQEDEEEPCEAEEMEEPRVIETLETITLSLVTTKRTVNGVTSVKRKHHFSTFMHHRPEDIDWISFFRYLQNESVERARARHEREDREAEYL